MMLDITLERAQGGNPSLITAQVLSPDDTLIGYRPADRRAGIVILHRGRQASPHYLQLGRAWAMGVILKSLRPTGMSRLPL